VKREVSHLLGFDLQWRGLVYAKSANSCACDVIHRKGSRTGHNESGETYKIEKIAFVARRTELRSGCGHRNQLDGAETIRQMHCKHRNSTAAIGSVATVINSPNKTAKPPPISVNIVS